MSEDNEEDPAIAIDLGTTNSCVAVFREGQVVIIPNDHGNRTTPSCVVFNEKGRLIGDAAKKITSVSPTSNSVYDVKRLIGRRFDDASSSLQADIDHLPMNVSNNEGYPVIKVVYKDEAKTFYPEDMSAMVLLKMKESAEAHLGEPVMKAVITVPAHFNSSQRQATKDAGRIAGLNVLQIMNEPSAAVMAYAFKEKVVGKRNVLVFSLGEWSCDVSVVAMDGGSCKVKSTRGDIRIGGQHFNTRMIDHFVQEIKNKHKTNVSSNKEALLLLRAACDVAKKLLSTSMEAPIDVTILVPRSRGILFQSSITRLQFEKLNDNLFFAALGLVWKAIGDAGLEESQIHKVILVGGSSRIPKIQTLLKRVFSEWKLYQSINVQEIVAYGAAIQGAIRQGDKSGVLNDLFLLDVAPLDLGIDDDGQLDDDQIAESAEVAEHYRIEDIRQRNLDGDRDAAVYYCRAVKSKAETLTMECKRVIQLLGTNQVADEEDVAQKKGVVEYFLHQMRSPAGDHQQLPLPSAKRPRTQ